MIVDAVSTLRPIIERAGVPSADLDDVVALAERPPEQTSVAVVGPQNAGKSTLIAVLTGSDTLVDELVAPLLDLAGAEVLDADEEHQQVTGECEQGKRDGPPKRARERFCHCGAGRRSQHQREPPAAGQSEGRQPTGKGEQPSSETFGRIRAVSAGHARHSPRTRKSRPVSRRARLIAMLS